MKQSYKIPYSIKHNRLDMEIAVQTKDGIGLRPLPVRILIFYIVTFVIGVICIMGTLPFMGALKLPFRIAFAVLLFAFTFMITQEDAAGKPHYEALPQMFNYMFVRASRMVHTRNTDDWSQLYKLFGIRDIDGRTGMIERLDGSKMYMYQVVGTGSALLFDEDKARIINEVDNFYRNKMPETVWFKYITVKESQGCNIQKYNLQQLNKKLTTKDPDLKNLMKDEYNTLRDFVGVGFKSIHQYMCICSENLEDLNRSHGALVNEVTNQAGVMFSEVTPLYKKDVIRVLKSIYKNAE